MARIFSKWPPQKNWVPIKPVTVEWWTRKSDGTTDTHSRIQLPLKLAWALTVWKSQGQTIRGKFCIDLEKQEKSHGLSYVALSRATKFSNIGLISALTGSRIKAINNNAATKVRKSHEVELETVSKLTEEKLRNLTDN